MKIGQQFYSPTLGKTYQLVVNTEKYESVHEVGNRLDENELKGIYFKCFEVENVGQHEAVYGNEVKEARQVLSRSQAKGVLAALVKDIEFQSCTLTGLLAQNEALAELTQASLKKFNGMDAMKVDVLTPSKDRLGNDVPCDEADVLDIVLRSGGALIDQPQFEKRENYALVGAGDDLTHVTSQYTLVGPVNILVTLKNAEIKLKCQIRAIEGLRRVALFAKFKPNNSPLV